MAKGLTNAEIAVRLGLSPETVKWHISELLALTSTASRDDLAQWWRSRKARAVFPILRPRLLLGTLAAGGALVAVVLVMAVLPGQRKAPSSGVATSSATENVHEATPAPVPLASPQPNLYGPPFFAQAKTARLAPTVRISGSDLPHAVIIPVVDYAAATNMFADTTNAWWTTEDMAPPPDDALRYELEFVLTTPDLSEVRSSGHACWYVPGDPPVVGPDCGWKGYVQPNEFFEAMLDRYIAIDKVGFVQERPTFTEALVATQKLFGAAIKIGQSYINGAVIPPRFMTGDDASHFLQLLGQGQLAMFGARGVDVTRRGPSVPLEVWFGGLRGPVVSYVTPGSLAPYGFLMARRQIGAWAPASTAAGEAWYQRVFAVSAAFDDLMGSFGYAGSPMANIDEYRIVPLGQGTGDWRRITGIQVWRAAGKGYDDRSQPRVSVAPPRDLCENGCDVQFVDLAMLEALSPACRAEIHPAGQEPFPEAVSSPQFNYYPPEAGRPGILEQVTGMTVGNGSYGLSWPIYVAPELDAVLSAACANLP